MKRDPVKPPADFTQEGRKLWLATQRQCKRQGTWTDTDAVTLERYCRSVLLSRAASRAAQAEPFVKSVTGQLVPHPAVKVAREAATDAHRFATSLLLTPEARSRHNVTVHAGQDPLLA